MAVTLLAFCRIDHGSSGVSSALVHIGHCKDVRPIGYEMCSLNLKIIVQLGCKYIKKTRYLLPLNSESESLCIYTDDLQLAELESDWLSYSLGFLNLHIYQDKLPGKCVWQIKCVLLICQSPTDARGLFASHRQQREKSRTPRTNWARPLTLIGMGMGTCPPRARGDGGAGEQPRASASRIAHLTGTWSLPVRA